jgi:hypothetical protein
MRSLPSPRPLIIVLALALGLAGCASGGGGASGAQPARRGSSNRIVADELATVPSLDAYQAIERLRPTWLRQRSGTPPVVVLDGNRQGGLEVLQSMRATEIQEMQYLDASDATTRFGTGFQGGAILVTSKR